VIRHTWKPKSQKEGAAYGKKDSRDARNLAKSYARGDLAIVHVPTEEEESVRHLIRCRLSFKDFEKN
jgi:hypothetical protein